MVNVIHKLFNKMDRSMLTMADLEEINGSFANPNMNSNVDQNFNDPPLQRVNGQNVDNYMWPN